MRRALRIATRRSPLALAQTRWVAQRLSEFHPELEVEEVLITTKGDKISDVPLSAIGGKGLFVSEIETAVLEGRADLAVHSLKDMPAKLAEGLELVCVPKREDARDVLVSRNGCALEELNAGARVGTSSLRRRVQLFGLRSDLDYATIRGNVDTRLDKLNRGEYDAIVLAYAGLRRLGLEQRPLRLLSVHQMVPAVGQGILALEAKTRDGEVKGLLQGLQDEHSRIEMVVERAFLEEIGGDCNVPLAGNARYDAQSLRLQFNAMVGSTVSFRQLRAGSECYLAQPGVSPRAQAEKVGREIAQRLLSQGAREMIREAQSISDPGASDLRFRPA
ncbi:MAG: hydroxymethylbilane synthase [Deltaproteobacteria bacterium]|nr:hydroxymethylbilane synthase [Deltaproteobacteria bacterium]